MRVRFIGVGDLGQREARGSQVLEVGAQYPVLEVYAKSGKSNMLRIEYSDRELPALYDSRMFEVVSERIPADWCVTSGVAGSLKFGPRSWTAPGFWEAFMDREPWAVDVYHEGRIESIRDAQDVILRI